MAQYSTGSVSLTSGSATVTGTGTFWAGLTVKQGDYLYVPGSVGRWQVASVASNTSLTLTTPYNGSLIGAGRSYVIVRDFTPNRWPLMSKGDLETAQIFSDVVTRLDTEIGEKTMMFSVPSVAGVTNYPVMLRSPTAIEITRVTYVMQSGSYGFNLRVNNTNVTGFTALAATTTQQTKTGTIGVGAGQKIEIQTTTGTGVMLMVQIDYRNVVSAV